MTFHENELICHKCNKILNLKNRNEYSFLSCSKTCSYIKILNNGEMMSYQLEYKEKILHYKDNITSLLCKISSINGMFICCQEHQIKTIIPLLFCNNIINVPLMFEKFNKLMILE